MNREETNIHYFLLVLNKIEMLRRNLYENIDVYLEYLQSSNV